MELPYIGCNIKQEREPADPVEELDFAYFADLGWEALERCKDLPEEGDDPNLLRGWRTLETGVSFPYVKAGDQDCAAESKGSDDTQNLELGVPENASCELR